MRLVITAFFCCLLHVSAWAQIPQDALAGRWEDDASTSGKSYQFVLNKQHLAFLSVSQAKILEPLAMPHEKLHSYKWLDQKHLRYAKLPDKNPTRAKYNPPKHALLRVDSIVKDLLYITLSDEQWLSKDLDSILIADKDGNWRRLFSDRKARYRRLNLEKQRNRARFLGLWEDNYSNDSVSLQLYAEKGVMGFNRVEAKDAAVPTAIKPNAGYYYHWITDNILYYYRQKRTGLSTKKDSKNPNVYRLMRIEQLDRTTLKVTLSARPFDKAGLNYIKKENQLKTYFQDDVIIYKRIPVVQKLSEPGS